MPKSFSANLDLLNGKLTPTILKLALPIMSTGLIQMAYAMTDTIWVGRLESGLVAVGTCGIILWFCDGLISLAKVGGQVNTAKYLGAKEVDLARAVAVNAVQTTCLIGCIILLCFNLLGQYIIGFFQFQNPHTVANALSYLHLISISVPFAFMGRTLSVISMANGNSKLPFKINACGLITNIILDPLFIFGFKMGVAGAAIATDIAQIVVCFALLNMLKHQANFQHLPWFSRFDWQICWHNFKLGLPVACQTLLMSSVAMGITKIVNNFSEAAIAAQRVGVQIESLSWLTAESFGGALTALVAQNFSAHKYQRTIKAIKKSLLLTLGLGVVTTSLLYCLPNPLIRIFSNDPAVLPFGVEYLKVIAVSQIFMCVEIVTTAAFNGFGKTFIPATINSICIGARIPLAWYFSKIWGTLGIWWTLSFSSICTSVILSILMFIFLERLAKEQHVKL